MASSEEKIEKKLGSSFFFLSDVRNACQGCNCQVTRQLEKSVQVSLNPFKLLTLKEQLVVATRKIHRRNHEKFK